jgi:hypothetical protein
MYKSLYGPFLSPTQKRCRGTHKEFLKALIKLLFLCNSEEYAETTPETSFKEYPKYSYLPHKPNPKSQFPELIFSNLTNISRKTSFVFKRDPERPQVFISAKITPIFLHQHIKTITLNYCLVYKNFEGT